MIDISALRAMLKSPSLPISPAKIEFLTIKLARYLEILLNWRKKINLIGGNEDDLIHRHLGDSLFPLTVLDQLAAKGNWADFGTGAGLPGLPLALARDAVSLDLCEKSPKKCLFLQTVVKELDLSDRVVVKNFDFRDSGPGKNYDLIICRALAPLPRLWPDLNKHLSSGGYLAVYKARRSSIEAELGRLKNRFSQKARIVAYQPPPTIDERHLVIWGKQ